VCPIFIYTDKENYKMRTFTTLSFLVCWSAVSYGQSLAGMESPLQGAQVAYNQHQGMAQREAMHRNLTAPNRTFTPFGAVSGKEYHPYGGSYKTYTYRVRLKNDSTFVRTGKIERYHHGDLLVMGKKRMLCAIRPDSTVAISRVLASGEELTGTPFEGYWLFEVITGEIKAYSLLPELKTRDISHFQYGDGVVREVDAVALGEIMDGDEVALELLREGEVGKAIRVYNVRMRGL
jgi:hypothetical protein